MAEDIAFTSSGALIGVRQSAPFIASDFAYGVVFGVLARQAGMSLAEVILMSGLVVSGSAQLIVVGLWVSPLPVTTIILTTLVVSLRYLVMGATLRPWFERLSRLKTYGTIFFMSDENWALTMREFAAGRYDGAFMLGSGILLTLSWLGFSILGYFIGGVVSDPAQWGLDFAFVAVFLALLVGMWKGKADLLPWGVAAVVAVVAARWLPGEWYILLGALAGSFVGVLRYGK